MAERPVAAGSSLQCSACRPWRRAERSGRTTAEVKPSVGLQAALRAGAGAGAGRSRSVDHCHRYDPRRRPRSWASSSVGSSWLCVREAGREAGRGAEGDESSFSGSNDSVC